MDSEQLDLGLTGVSTVLFLHFSLGMWIRNTWTYGNEEKRIDALAKDLGEDAIDSVVEKLSERQLVIYKTIRKSVVETASSIASKIKLSPRTIQRDLTRLKDLNVIKHEGPDNGGYWVVLMDLNV